MRGWPEDASTAMADFVFELGAGTLAGEHAEALAQALREVLPWLAEEPLAGVLPLSGLSRGNGHWFVGRRSRLVLRLPLRRAAGADSLAGTTLNVAGGTLAVGAGTRRPLQPVTEVVYSHFVSVGTPDELEFLDHCRAALADRGLRANPVTGRARRMDTSDGPVEGFALMLHGLNPTDSVAIQEDGLGRHRLYGCGVFVPHKSITAVGD